MTKTLASASLDALEQRVVSRFAASLEEMLGDRLLAVWLYGSRARGEEPGVDSDVDLMVVTAAELDARDIDGALYDAAEGEGANPFRFSVQVFDRDFLDRRRRIESFYIREVDRDKIVVSGIP